MTADVLLEHTPLDAPSRYQGIGRDAHDVANAPADRAHAAGVADRTQRLGFAERGNRIPRCRGALANALPSIYEAFRLPVLESIACPCPTSAAKVTSMSE